MQSHQRTGGVNGSVTLGDGLTQRQRYPGTEVTQCMGYRGEDPIGGLVDQPPKLILILKMDVKLTFYEGKIENAYVSRCFLQRTRAAVLSSFLVAQQHWLHIVLLQCLKINHQKLVAKY